MIRGTTAQFKIKLPYTRGELEWVTIKWWQDGNLGTVLEPLPITKKLTHCSISDIYTCELPNDTTEITHYYFEIDGVKYGFTALPTMSVGDTLTYNSTTKTLIANGSSIPLRFVDNIDNLVQLMFVNEVDNSKELSVSLTAQETKRFSDRHKAKMQLRGKLKSSGLIFGCKPKLITVYPINDDLFDDSASNIGNDEWVALDGGLIASADGEWSIIDGETVID